MSHRLPTLAIINTSPDTVDMLRIVFQQAGMLVVSGLTYDIRDGRMNLDGFMKQHKPDALIYDIAPPYDQNWAFFEHLRETGVIKDVPVVLTSTNVRSVRALVGEVPDIHEIIGKPYDLNELLEAVREAMGSGRAS